MSLMLLKRSPFRASFTYGERGKKSLPVPNIRVGGPLDHTDWLIWMHETASHSTCGERARFIARAASCCFGTARFWHEACARTNVPLLLNNDCSQWCLQEQTRSGQFRQHKKEESSALSWHAIFATWISCSAKNSFHAISYFVISSRDGI